MDQNQHTPKRGNRVGGFITLAVSVLFHLGAFASTIYITSLENRSDSATNLSLALPFVAAGTFGFFMSIAGAILFCIGLLLASGVGSPKRSVLNNQVVLKAYQRNTGIWAMIWLGVSAISLLMYSYMTIIGNLGIIGLVIFIMSVIIFIIHAVWLLKSKRIIVGSDHKDS